jgi:hypothetical protein
MLLLEKTSFDMILKNILPIGDKVEEKINGRIFSILSLLLFLKLVY